MDGIRNTVCFYSFIGTKASAFLSSIIEKETDLHSLFCLCRKKSFLEVRRGGHNIMQHKNLTWGFYQ